MLSPTLSVSSICSRRTMAKKRKKTDFTEQNARIKEARELIERERARLREQRARDADEPKSA
jgi:hypothetical protein